MAKKNYELTEGEWAIITKGSMMRNIVLTMGLLLLCSRAMAAEKKVPDFTAGGTIPAGWDHDWTLGPTGARGWIYCEALGTAAARQIQITQVAAGSPADAVLEVGDVILGVGDKPFDDDARVLFGKAITEAEKKDNQGELHLIRWRSGKTENVIVKLQVMGSYSATAPYNCPKSKLILEQGFKALAKKIKENPAGGNVVMRALNAMSLLASGNREYLPIVREQAKLLSQYTDSSNVRTWQYAYVNIFLAEYVLATGDRTYVDQGLKRITDMIVDGQGPVGGWGHDFADPKTKQLTGYGMMNAVGLPLTYSLALARKAGVHDPELDDAIHKSLTLLEFFVNKGAFSYGDHYPWRQTHENNGVCGLAAVLFDFVGRAKPAEYFSRMSVAAHGAERDEGHTGNFFNLTWALPGVARSGQHATGAWMAEFGWYFDLARRWDGTFLHQGPPEPRTDSYKNWDATGAYLLGYAQPLKKTYLTGRKSSAAPQVDRAAAERLLDDGRGWSTKDGTSYYAKMSTPDLLQRLSSWSPIVRERAAAELGRRRDDVVPQLIRLLEAPDLYGRNGACQAIRLQGGRAAAAVPALRKALHSGNLGLRLLAVDAICAIGKPARAVVPELLKMLTESDPKDDPRGMMRRRIAIFLFAPLRDGGRNGLIDPSLEGVDPELLIEAVRACLRHYHANARSQPALVFKHLSFEQLQPLLPAIQEAIKTKALSNMMGAHEVRVTGLECFAKHRISEGIELLVDYSRVQNPWMSETRIVRLLELLVSYGAHGQRVIPKMEALAVHFENGEKGYPRNLSIQKAKLVRDTIKKIEALKDYPKLFYLKPLKKED